MESTSLKTLTFITFLSLGLGFSVKAQEKMPKEHLWQIDFGGAIGLFVPYDQAKGESMILGTTSQTSVQFNYKKQFFARVKISETSVGYKSSDSFPGVKSTIDANSYSTNLGFDFGYHHGLGSWEPFIFAGLGPSLARHPQAVFDQPANVINYSNTSDILLNANIGIGVNYNVSKSIMLLLECNANKMPGLPKTPSTHLNGINALINVKIAL